MTSKSVAERPQSQVPALVQTPALTITAEDIALPRIYTGQFMSEAVKNQYVKAGDIFSATGKDDQDPNILWSYGSSDPGPVLHVISLRKAKSISEGGELTQFDFDDPAAPPEAWVTYNYTVAIPDVDADVPFKLLLTKSSRPAALAINTILKKNSIAGPAWINAFEITSFEKSNQKGKWYVPKARVVEADQKAVEAAEALAVQMSSSVVEHSATGEEPQI